MASSHPGPGSAPGGSSDDSRPELTLFTRSAVRYHLPRHLPPTPGKEPRLRDRIKALVGRLLGGPR